MRRAALSRLLPLALALLGNLAQAQQSERFGNYELHYSVVNTTFLAPDVAAHYGITRGRNQAMLNLALRVHGTAGSEPRQMQLQGRTWDAIHSRTLQFREIREGEAIYYIAQFEFINEEWRWFEFDFLPEGEKRSLAFKFKHQLYVN